MARLGTALMYVARDDIKLSTRLSKKRGLMTRAMIPPSMHTHRNADFLSASCRLPEFSPRPRAPFAPPHRSSLTPSFHPSKSLAHLLAPSRRPGTDCSRAAQLSFARLFVLSSPFLFLLLFFFFSFSFSSPFLLRLLSFFVFFPFSSSFLFLLGFLLLFSSLGWSVSSRSRGCRAREAFPHAKQNVSNAPLSSSSSSSLHTNPNPNPNPLASINCLNKPTRYTKPPFPLPLPSQPRSTTDTPR